MVNSGQVNCSIEAMRIFEVPWRRDGTAQLYYAPYRYYSPATARWITRDPLGMVDGPNMYGYAQSNPSTYFDNLGLTCCTDMKGNPVRCPDPPDPCKQTQGGVLGVADCQKCCEKQAKWTLIWPWRKRAVLQCCFKECLGGSTGKDGKKFWKACKLGKGRL